MSKFNAMEEVRGAIGKNNTNAATVANFIRNRIEGARDYQRCTSGQWYHLHNGVWEPEDQWPRAAAALINKLVEYFHYRGYEETAHWIAGTRWESLATAMEKTWESRPADQWNNEDMYLPLQVGALDLFEGKRHDKVDPTKFFTRRANTTFHPEHGTGRFGKFVEEVMPDAELRNFLGRYCFYCLTGRTDLQTFLINHGYGANGKSVFWEAIRHMMGDFAVQPDPAILRRKKMNSSGHDADIAQIAGHRLLCFEEIGGKRLAEACIKHLTTAQTLAFRPAYASTHVTARNVSKLAMNTNHLPSFDGADRGLVRRMAILNWEQQIPRERQDPTLLNDLQSRPSEILNWVLLHREDFMRDGLNRPSAVEAATEEHALSNNDMLDFITASVRLEPGATTEGTLFRRAYAQFMEDSSPKDGWRHFYQNLVRELNASLSDTIKAERLTKGWVFHNVALLENPDA